MPLQAWQRLWDDIKLTYLVVEHKTSSLRKYLRMLLYILGWATATYWLMYEQIVPTDLASRVGHRIDIDLQAMGSVSIESIFNFFGSMLYTAFMGFVICLALGFVLVFIYSLIDLYQARKIDSGE